MAYTIIEVERQTNIPSRTIRFWLDKGLFPFIHKEQGVRYFAKSDIEWARWIYCLRMCEMSIADIKRYIMLSKEGFSSAQERKNMLEKQASFIKQHIQELHSIQEKLHAKITMYEQMIQHGTDFLNPNSAHYKSPKKRSKQQRT